MASSNHDPDKAAERVSDNIDAFKNRLKDLHDLEVRVSLGDLNGEELSELGRLLINLSCCLLNIRAFAKYMRRSQVIFWTQNLKELTLEVHPNLEYVMDQYITPRITQTIEELVKLAQPPSRETNAATHTANHNSLGN